MNFKIAISLIFLSIILTACDSPSYISGKLENTENKNLKVYLIKPNALQELASSYLGAVIDSAKVNADGSFEFRNTPKTNEPLLLEFAVQTADKLPNYLENDIPNQSNYIPIVWQQGERIQITASFKNIQSSLNIVNPSKSNKALLNLRDIKHKAYETYLEGKEWQVEEGDELIKQEHAVLQYQTALMQFADSATNLLPALVALRWASPENDYERIPEFLVSQCRKWTKNEANHPWVKQLCKISEPSNLPVLVGNTFPNVSLPLITKESQFLKELLGRKLTIIDLWASWCAPCRKENREVFVPLWDTYSSQGLQIIAYGLESDETSWKQATIRDGANRWIQASDLQGDDAGLLKTIRIKTIPSNFILDHNGMVLAKNLHGKALINFVENYIKNH